MARLQGQSTSDEVGGCAAFDCGGGDGDDGADVGGSGVGGNGMC